MAVRIRMKQMGRTHRPFYRICAVEKRAPRDGKVLEELGTYDPMVRDTDARVQLNAERVDYWIGVGAQPSEKVAVLIKKYGTNGTHVDENRSAIEKLAQPRSIPERGEPVAAPHPEQEAAEDAVLPADKKDDVQTAEESAVDVTAASDPAAVTDETTGEAIKEAETPADTEEKPIE